MFVRFGLIRGVGKRPYRPILKMQESSNKKPANLSRFNNGSAAIYASQILFNDRQGYRWGNGFTDGVWAVFGGPKGTSDTDDEPHATGGGAGGAPDDTGGGGAEDAVVDGPPDAMEGPRPCLRIGTPPPRAGEGVPSQQLAGSRRAAFCPTPGNPSLASTAHLLLGRFWDWSGGSASSLPGAVWEGVQTPGVVGGSTLPSSPAPSDFCPMTRRGAGRGGPRPPPPLSFPYKLDPPSSPGEGALRKAFNGTGDPGRGRPGGCLLTGSMIILPLARHRPLGIHPVVGASIEWAATVSAPIPSGFFEGR